MKSSREPGKRGGVLQRPNPGHCSEGGSAKEAKEEWPAEQGKAPERVVFQNEGVENGSTAAEQLCSRRPLELTLRLHKTEVTGDSEEQFHWDNRDKCLTEVDQRAKAQFLPGVLM